MSNDPNRRKPKGPQPGNDDENRKARRIVMLIVAALIATLLINSLYTTISNAYLTEITYTEFKELLASDQISEVEFQSVDRIVILTKDQAEKPKFSVNMLNKMLKNRAYIGEYHHGDIVVEGGMPVLVDEATFEHAQRRFAENKRKDSQRAHGMDDAEAPRYWLTGKLYCGECGSTMQGVSGTSKTGRKYYYYYCSAQRRKECHLHKARKRDLEDMVLFALHNIVDDEENVVALALDAAEYYEKSHNDTAYLEALEAKRREVEKSLANLVKVIEKGVVSDTVTERLTQLEEQKRALNDAIGTENVRVSLCEDKHSIQAYFDKFLHADVNDPEIRDQVFEYFVDKVYLYDDKLVVSMWFSEDDKQEITWRDWFSLDEYWTDESPFVKGGGVEFDCFPLGSTRSPP